MIFYRKGGNIKGFQFCIISSLSHTPTLLALNFVGIYHFYHDVLFTALRWLMQSVRNNTTALLKNVEGYDFSGTCIFCKLHL